MFVSTPRFEFPIPAVLAGPGAKFWRGVELSSNVPWFIATFDVCEDGVNVLHTVCLWWESDLVGLMGDGHSGRLVELQCLMPPWYSAAKAWTMRRVTKIWRAKDRTAQDAEVFVFLDDNGKEFCGGIDWRPPTPAVHGRELLATVPASRRRRQATY
jgi:hypothetical protein